MNSSAKPISASWGRASARQRPSFGRIPLHLSDQSELGLPYLNIHCGIYRNASDGLDRESSDRLSFAGSPVNPRPVIEDLFTRMQLEHCHTSMNDVCQRCVNCISAMTVRYAQYLVQSLRCSRSPWNYGSQSESTKCSRSIEARPYLEVNAHHVLKSLVFAWFLKSCSVPRKCRVGENRAFLGIETFG